MDEAEDIPGEELGPLLRGPHRTNVVRALIGCSFYRNDPDDLSKIVECDPASGRLTVQHIDGKTKVASLATGYVLISLALRTAMDAAFTPELRAEKQARAAIAAFGFAARIEQQDLAPLVAAIASIHEGTVPQFEERREALRIAEKYGNPHVVAKLAAVWCDVDKSVILPDVLISLLAALRNSGRNSEALGRSEILRQPRLRLTPQQAQILFTERAAILADRYEQTGEPAYLVEARKAANRSWANGESEYCSHVYERLKKLEQQLKP